MYNRYLNAAAEDSPPLHNQDSQGYYQNNQGYFDETPAFQPQLSQQHQPPQNITQQTAAISELTRNLSGKLQNIKFDMNTVIMLAVIWFLLSDNGEVDWEQFLTIGILFILGL